MGSTCSVASATSPNPVSNTRPAQSSSEVSSAAPFLRKPIPMSNSSPNSSSSSSVAWEWCREDLQWGPFHDSCNYAIESAYARGDPSVEFTIGTASSPTHFIFFQPQTLKQVNLRTQRQRAVRRDANSMTSEVTWQWWEAETNSWQDYDKKLIAKFEKAWKSSNCSQRKNQSDNPAGLHFKINGHNYAMLFEVDGQQYSMQTLNSRAVRRRTLEMNQPSTSVCNAGAPSRKSSNSNFDLSFMTDCSGHNADENCTICLDGFEDDNAVKLNMCNHFFHRECILEWFQKRPSCPQCSTVYGEITGTQPPGHMNIKYIPFNSREAKNGLEGYSGIDIIQITYLFPDGIQTEEHPSPGARYTGTRRVAYLPRNQEGEEVLELFKIAWKRRLLFIIGTSVTSGRSDTVVWAGIHHKTNRSGGSSNYGYPDEAYFDRVKKELAAVNVVWTLK